METGKFGLLSYNHKKGDTTYNNIVTGIVVSCGDVIEFLMWDGITRIHVKKENVVYFLLYHTVI